MSNFLDELDQQKTAVPDFLSELEAAPVKPPANAPVASDGGQYSGIGNLGYGALKGLADVVQAPAQIGLNLLNSGGKTFFEGSDASKYVNKKTNEFNDYLGNQEKLYQLDTPGSIPAGIGRTVANVAPFLATGGTSAAGGLTAKALLKSAASGAGTSAISQPINEVQTNADGSNDFLKQKAIQAGLGAAGGVGGSLVGAGLGRLANPQVSSATKAALDEGITPTIGQMLGGWAAAAENKLTSVPFLGEIIKNGQRSTTTDFNRAAYNRALHPIGLDAKDIPVGHEGIAFVKKELGDNYDRILSKINFKGDAQAGQELAAITAKMGSGDVTPAVAQQFNSILKNNVLGKMSKGAELPGDRFKIVLSDLSNLSKRFGKSLDPNQQILGQRLGEVQDVLKNNLVRTNPEFAEKLQANHLGYANYVRLRQAASGVGTDNGVFTPAQLAAAVKAQDSSVGKGASATGNALMQDLVKTGKNIAPTYPDSGTAGRLGEMATVATLLTQPQLAIPAVLGGAAAAVPYTQPGKKLAAAILARRPASAPAIDQGLRGLSPALGAILAGGSIPLLNN